MTDEGITGGVASRSVGVLGLPTDGAPSLRPLSYGFDGESRLCFRYVVDGESRKADPSDRSEVARVLIDSAETPYDWRSVLLT